MARIECRNLGKRYGTTDALHHINLEIEAGQIVGLLGPNGSGKTTLIKLANGLLKPTEGEILIDGFQPGVETKSMVAYLPDCDVIPGYMKVKEAVRFYEDFFQDFDARTAFAMLDTLDINFNQSFKSLSKGTKEKVELVLTMSRKAKVYLLDEPIGGVDPATRDYILKTIITNYNPEAVVLISTHLITDVEPVLDDIVFIQNGNIVLHRLADDLRAEYGKSVDAIFREVFKC